MCVVFQTAQDTIVQELFVLVSWAVTTTRKRIFLFVKDPLERECAIGALFFVFW